MGPGHYVFWCCLSVCAYVHVRVSVGLCVRLCRGAKVEKSLNFGLLWLQWKKKALQAESLLEKVPAHKHVQAVDQGSMTLTGACADLLCLQMGLQYFIISTIASG